MANARNKCQSEVSQRSNSDVARWRALTVARVAASHCASWLSSRFGSAHHETSMFVPLAK